MRLRLLPADSPLGWTPYAWLVYLSFFLVWAVVRNEPRHWLLDGPLVVAFLALYFRGFWVCGGALVPVIAGIVAIGVVTAFRNPGASCFFIFASGFAGELGSPARGIRAILAIVAVAALQSWLVVLSPSFWVPAIALSLLIGGTNVHFGEVRRKDQALLRAHQQAEALARLAERERIARDLHDLLGHTLSLIVLKSELAAKLAERNPARAAAEIRDVEQISRTALAEVRRAIHGYRGERLGDEIDSSRKALEAAGVAFEVDVDAVALPPDTERALALALREAVTNVIRHAGARRCSVHLAGERGGVCLTIADDGIGGEAAPGAGLSGMQQRLREVGGRLERDGARGTRLTIRVPAAEPAAARAAS